MISMSDVNSIRQMRRDGESVASIARAVGVSRDTVYKYLKKNDFSPDLPRSSTHTSLLSKNGSTKM